MNQERPRRLASFIQGFAIVLVSAIISNAAATALVMAWTGPTSAPPNGNVSAPINVGATDQVKNGNLGVGGLAVFGNSILLANSYINWGATVGSGGYGIRDNAGLLEFKNSGGSWQTIQTIVSNLVSGAGQWATGANSAIYYNDGNVGIGTGAPAAPLEVVKTQTGTSGSMPSVAGTMYAAPSSNQTLGGSAKNYAGRFYAQVPSSNTRTVNFVIGVDGEAENYGTGAKTSILGMQGWAYNGAAASVTSVSGAGSYAQVDNGTVQSLRSVDAWNGAYGGNVSQQIGISSWLSHGGGTVTNRYGLYLGADGTATNDFGIYQDSGQDNYFSGNIYAAGYFHNSDLRMKDHIVTSPGLAVIKNLRGVTFTWTKDNAPGAGVIAQEVEKVMPSAVSENAVGMKTVEYDQLIAPLIEAIKEQQVEIESLKNEINQLKAAAR